jgi:4-amino-4-deoxy-L-arabinose transferase-like glycosyltransferase
MSWRNLFFGALEPGGSVSVDKPPVALWLQVASVKLFGWNATALSLPEVLGGTAAVLLLFLAVRRVFGVRAGLAAAAAMAVLPVAVITSRSDTMDALMGALLALALLCVARAGERGSTGWLVGAAGALGLAFNVKLAESLVALPGLLVFAWLALPGGRRRRLSQITLAGAVYVVVSFLWLTATLAFPAHERPWADGSSNGSAWNAAFVGNGIERIEGNPEGGAPLPKPPPGGYPERTQAQRDAIPVTEPSVGRLLVRVGPLSGERLGLELLVALLLGSAAGVALLVERQQGTGTDAIEGSGPSTQARLQRAMIAGLLVWLLAGAVLFTLMTRLHPRYTEAFTPAVAATLGVGLGWATGRASRWRLAVLGGTLAVAVVYGELLLFGTPAVWWISLAAALAALALAGADVALGARRSRDGAIAGPAGVRAEQRLRLTVATLALVCVLAVPLSAALRAVRQNRTDANSLGVLPQGELDRLSAFLRTHQGSARYEVAYESASRMGALVVKDRRPILVLTTARGRALTSVARLRALAAAGEVRYAIVMFFCTPHAPPTSPQCSPPGRWITTHGTNVSRQAGLGRAKHVLWRLPGTGSVTAGAAARADGAAARRPGR